MHATQRHRDAVVAITRESLSGISESRAVSRRRRSRAGELAGTTEGEIAWNVAEKTHEFLKDRKELHDWWDSVRAGDSERLRILFLAGFTRPDQPDPLEPAVQTIALELAVRRGDAAMVELAALVGFYHTVSIVLNTFQVEAPEGDPHPLKY